MDDYLQQTENALKELDAEFTKMSNRMQSNNVTDMDDVEDMSFLKMYTEKPKSQTNIHEKFVEAEEKPKKMGNLIAKFETKQPDHKREDNKVKKELIKLPKEEPRETPPKKEEVKLPPQDLKPKVEEPKKVLKEEPRESPRKEDVKPPQQDLKPATIEEDQNESEEQSQNIFSVIPPKSIPPGKGPALKKFLAFLLNEDFPLVLAVSEATQVTEKDKVASALVTVFAYVGAAGTLLKEQIQQEVNCTNDANTLFRGNSMSSKCMSQYAKRIAEPYLHKLLKPFLETVCTNPNTFEIDPAKSKEGEDLSINAIALVQTCQTLLDRILNSLDEVPTPIRQLCSDLKAEVEKKFPSHSNVAVAGFFFLRFINPSIVAPDRMLSEVTAESRRKFVLISKVIQSLANNLLFDDKKEQYMMVTNQFITQHKSVVELFLENVAMSPDVKEPPTYLRASDEELFQAVNSLAKHIFTDQKKIILELKKNKSPSAIKIDQELPEVIHILGNEPPIIVTKESSPTPVPSLSSSSPSNSTQSQEYSDKLYKEYLRKSDHYDFSDIIASGALFQHGNDYMGRPIVIFDAEKMNHKSFDLEKFFLYIIRFMDPIVSKDYVFVYIHTVLDSDRKPTFAWLKNAYQTFNRKYKKNVKKFIIVQSTRWLRVLITCFRPFISNKFWKKLIYVDDKKDLEKYLANTELPTEPPKKSLSQRTSSMFLKFRAT